MKLSNYSILFVAKNEHLIYNSLSGTYAKISKDLYYFLSEIKHADQEIDCTLIDEEIRNQLINNNIIVDNIIDEKLFLKSIIFNRRFDKSIMILTIAPTLDCNFSCEYCFEKKQNVYMDNKTVENILNLINKKNNLKQVNLTWFGGEPLLAFNTIKYFYSNLKLSPKTKLNAHLITNGYFLEEPIIHKLIEFNIGHIQVTLDGKRTTHNKKKFMINDNDSFSKIINNIDLFSKINTKTSLTIRVNIDKNNQNEYIQVFNFINKRYKKNNNISITPGYIQKNSNEKCIIDESCILNNKDKALFLKNLYYKNNITHLSFYPHLYFYECAIRNHNCWAIAPNGDIYKCWEILGDIDYKVGELTERGIEITNLNMLNRYLYCADPYESNKCTECKFLPICNGGCPHKRIENVIKNENYESCTFYKKYLKDFLIAHKEIVSNKKLIPK